MYLLLLLLQFSMPCPKTPTVIFTSVLVLIQRTSLFVNVRTSSLINSVHQIIYYVVDTWQAVTDVNLKLSFLFLSILCSFILFNLLFSATACSVKYSCLY